ncbi:hypothetical protein OC846_005230 [Tilletia horrida]|uniref:Uncharacterized protein n=1 Tax=Tilletia horrida TaxID=155126 RepID=A0AAN6GNR0_9BASI|nr:hypothetical protein OC846_005230 [Tilletia horrida]
MAFALNQYSPCLFENLDSLADAATQLRLVGGLAKIIPALNEVGRKHPCSRDYAIHLLHRHVFLADDEVMITMGGGSGDAVPTTTFPIKVADISERKMDKLHASVWGLRPGTGMFVPLEFAVDDVAPPDGFQELDAAFAKDVAAIFVEFQLEHVLGLALISEDVEPGLETAQGRANIVTPLDLYATPVTSITEVLWPFPRFEDDSDGSQEEEKVKRNEWRNVHVSLLKHKKQLCPTFFVYPTGAPPDAGGPAVRDQKTSSHRLHDPLPVVVCSSGKTGHLSQSLGSDKVVISHHLTGPTIIQSPYHRLSSPFQLPLQKGTSTVGSVPNGGAASS